MRKTKSFSHIQAQDALERLNDLHLSGDELIYNLLQIFCGYGDGNIRRIRDGVGNKAKDGRTILIPNLIAYRPKRELGFFEEVKSMQADPKITKQSPRLYVVSDGRTIVAEDLKEQEIYENEVALMWKDFDFFYPLAGIEKFRNIEEADADVKSAELMAKIFDEIRRHNDIKDQTQMHNLNVFMSRLLFCFFAEDTNLFPEENLFTNSIRQYTAEDGHDLAEFIDRAFLVMSTKDRTVLDVLPKVYSAFPYVNGGLFEQQLPIPVLSRRTRALMLKCGDYDWADINPDIFGSMIQAVVSPEERSGLGIHYTSVPNIMKVIRPLFLDALAEEYVREKDNPKGLRALLARMKKIKFFDPACGSGNFLIISYKRLRELEIEIWCRLQTLAGGQSEMPFSNISLTQFYGIELDEYACDTAILSLWLAEHQMNNMFYEKLGSRPDALPLRPSGHIVCGNACRLDWNEVCPHTAEDEVYIMGNPPYIGSKLQTTEQKADMAIALSGLKENKSLDYIASWFWKGANYIRNSASRYAFVTTNSICQGEQVGMLWSHIFDLGLVICFARTSFKWSNNAKYNAGVTCAIVGVSNQFVGRRALYNESTQECRWVENINPYLSGGADTIVCKTHKTPPKLPKMSFGCMPYDNGNLLMTGQEREDFIAAYPQDADLVKKVCGSYEFINQVDRFCFWIDDADLPRAVANPYIAARIERTRQVRLNSKDKAGRELAERPHQFREHFDIYANTIIVPSVSSERRIYIPMGYVDKDTVISNLAFAIYNAEPWLFAILTSKLHNIWVRTVGGRLKTDYRYSATLCYNTFPFPKINAVQKAELEALAQEILDIRDQHFDMTLGEMYNPETMPEDLLEAHRRLDFVVERCYRLAPFTSDEERLEYLFKLYVKMTKK